MTIYISSELHGNSDTVLLSEFHRFSSTIRDNYQVKAFLETKNVYLCQLNWIYF